MALDNAVATVEFLLNHGANTELQDCDGRTALHVAASAARCGVQSYVLRESGYSNLHFS